MVRGVAREEAILAAVVELLAEVGYEAMTMDAVAARAHASKTTMYRRWRGKPELVRAAVDRRVAGRIPVAGDTGSPAGDVAHDTGSLAGGVAGDMRSPAGDVAHDTGSLAGDLHAAMRAVREHLTPEFMAMMGGLVQAMRQDPALAASLRTLLLDENAVATEIIGRAAARGELPRSRVAHLAPLVHAVIEGQVLRRTMFGAALDDEFCRQLIDDIILPLIHGSMP